MSKKNNNSSWLKRLWKGGSKQLADEMLNKDGTPNDAEAIISPGRQMVNNFLERKLAVGALVLLICMRYSLDIEGDSDGDPVEVLVHDKVLIALCLVLAVTMMGMLYL